MYSILIVACAHEAISYTTMAVINGSSFACLTKQSKVIDIRRVNTKGQAKVSYQQSNIKKSMRI
jgi:hypothetical protein